MKNTKFIVTYVILSPRKGMKSTRDFMLKTVVHENNHITDAVLMFWSDEIVEKYTGPKDLKHIAKWMNAQLNTRFSIYNPDSGNIYSF
ncbi:MAG: hypothetical protein GY841_15630 [FCB group bacterium]|nr:hypothetical protein [FCB group bacterium]